MGRYMKRADVSAGVYGDKSLDDGEWVIKAKIEEIKGRGTELVGQERVVLRIKDGTAKWSGLPDLRW